MNKNKVIFYKCASTKEELEQILILQQINLSTSVSYEEKINEGFVTVRHTMKILSRMNNLIPHIIAKEEEKVVGYALCMHPDFAKDIAVLKPMFSKIKSIIKKDKKYIVMGQICIDKVYRKKGIFRMLYITMKNSIAPNYSTIITEVDVTNSRSLQAHYAIGFKTLITYQAEGHQWELIYWK